MVMITRLSALILMLVLAPLVAASSAPKEEGPPKTNYVKIQPAFVVNYGGKGDLHYLKVEMSMRAPDAKVADAIKHHQPYIQNEIILLLSKQGEEVLGTIEGKEHLRQEALGIVNRILKDEADGAQITDLYFNQFVMQR